MNNIITSIISHSISSASTSSCRCESSLLLCCLAYPTRRILQRYPPLRDKALQLRTQQDGLQASSCRWDFLFPGGGWWIYSWSYHIWGTVVFWVWLTFWPPCSNVLDIAWFHAIKNVHNVVFNFVLVGSSDHFKWSGSSQWTNLSRYFNLNCIII